MNRSPRGVCLPFILLALSCGGSSGGSTPFTDGGDHPSADATRDAGASTTADAPSSDAPRSASPALADLQGAWYAETAATDAGAGVHRRLVVRSGDYYETANEPGSYCTEVGTVEVSAGQVRFVPGRVVGMYCQMKGPRAGAASWTDAGLAVAFPGGATRYARSRDVAKVFLTVEVHDGDFADDSALPGANVIEKADAFCNQSAARPDNQTYRAVIVDGVHRSAAPPVDWVLQPNTTYFQADGVLNVFRTTADGLTRSEGNNAVLSDADQSFRYAWMGLDCGFGKHLTCNGWASRDGKDVGSVGDSGQAQFTFGCNVSVPCNQPANLVCVSAGAPADSRDAGVDGGGTPGGADAGAKSLEGSWYSRLPSTDAGLGARRRLRFAGSTYYLVVDSMDRYCAETGTFVLAGAELRLTPDHTEGFGTCVERAAHAEPIAWNGDGFSLQSEGTTISYAPIRDVPKVFLTVESHDGNLVGDATLAGATAAAKADAVCNGSLAKPDTRHYKAVLADGANRAPPAKDWPLAPLTTYFEADGVGNVFTTDRDTMSYEKQGQLLVSGWVDQYWTGLNPLAEGPLNCNGWTSRDGRGSSGSLSYHDYPLGRTSMPCSSRDQVFLCVGEGRSLPELAGPAQGSGDTTELQGSWQTTETLVWPTTKVSYTAFRTLRIEGANYRLIDDSLGVGYCGEIGKLERSSDTVRFLPARIDGIGSCAIGSVRTVTVARAGAMLTLTSGGKAVVYHQVADVPKVFVTFEAHDGAFATDARLPGTGAFQKADAFCNQSTARPDGQSYKAVMVDGVGRSARPPVDWPLKPATTYFYPDGVTPMFQTDAMALQVQSTLKPFIRGAVSAHGSAWSGLYAAGMGVPDNCKGWTVADGMVRGAITTDSAFGANYIADCNDPQHVVCVSQAAF